MNDQPFYHDIQLEFSTNDSTELGDSFDDFLFDHVHPKLEQAVRDEYASEQFGESLLGDSVESLGDAYSSQILFTTITGYEPESLYTRIRETLSNCFEENGLTGIQVRLHTDEPIAGDPCDLM